MTFETDVMYVLLNPMYTCFMSHRNTSFPPYGVFAADGFCDFFVISPQSSLSHHLGKMAFQKLSARRYLLLSNSYDLNWSGTSKVVVGLDFTLEECSVDIEPAVHLGTYSEKTLKFHTHDWWTVEDQFEQVNTYFTDENHPEGTIVCENWRIQLTKVDGEKAIFIIRVVGGQIEPTYTNSAYLRRSEFHRLFFFVERIIFEQLSHLCRCMRAAYHTVYHCTDFLRSQIRRGKCKDNKVDTEIVESAFENIREKHFNAIHAKVRGKVIPNDTNQRMFSKKELTCFIYEMITYHSNVLMFIMKNTVEYDISDIE